MSSVDDALDRLHEMDAMIETNSERGTPDWYVEAVATVRQRFAEQDEQIQRLREAAEFAGVPAWTRLYQRAESAEAENRQLREGLRDFAEHGTRFDTNPTRIIPTDPVSIERDRWWASRARSMDRAVRDRASALLAGSEAEPDGGGAK